LEDALKLLRFAVAKASRRAAALHSIPVEGAFPEAAHRTEAVVAAVHPTVEAVFPEVVVVADFTAAEEARLPVVEEAVALREEAGRTSRAGLDYGFP
jgi:hypothetical protein